MKKILATTVLAFSIISPVFAWDIYNPNAPTYNQGYQSNYPNYQQQQQYNYPQRQPFTYQPSPQMQQMQYEQQRQDYINDQLMIEQRKRLQNARRY